MRRQPKQKSPKHRISRKIPVWAWMRIPCGMRIRTEVKKISRTETMMVTMRQMISRMRMRTKIRMILIMGKRIGTRQKNRMKIFQPENQEFFRGFLSELRQRLPFWQ